MPLDIARVDTVREAVTILAAEAGARFLAGGTLVVREVNTGTGSIDRLILADGLGLDRIENAGGRITIGATATMAAVGAHPDLAFLKAAVNAIGGPAVRNMATVGGNLFAPYPHGDFAVALLALGADVTVESVGGTEQTDLEAFLEKRDGATTSLVRSVGFAVPPTGAFRFAKVTRKRPHGASVLSIAAVLPMAERKVSGARVAYGAMAARPMRARAVEQALEGRPLDQPAVAAAVKVATEGTAPLSDPQASEWYRLQVLPVHLARLLSA